VPFVPAFIDRLQLQGPPSNSRKLLSPQETASRFIHEFSQEHGQNQLPFLDKGYAHSLDDAKKDLKFLLVVLISPEHSVIRSYVKDTLTSESVINYLRDNSNNILLWGGSVRDTEAYQVSTAFNVTRFPYAALVAHAPSSNSSTTSGMSILTTMEGPMPPAAFLAKIRRAIDTYSPELISLRADRAEREATRNFRVEQDTAYERSLAKDRERAKKKKEDAERQQREAKESAKAEKEALHHAQQTENWRLWRAGQVKLEPDASDKNTARISLRLSNGDRIIRRFSGDSPIEEIYAIVECWDLLQDGFASKEATKPANFTFQYKFQLVSPIPRTVFAVDNKNSISHAIGRSANLMVEIIAEEDD
jgi:FAS-associated factor 2